MLEIFRRDTIAHRTNGMIVTDGEVVDELLVRLSASLGAPFVRMEGPDMTLGDVIEAFRYEPCVIGSLEPRMFRMALNGCVKQVVQGEIVAREGLSRNLQYSETVVRDLSEWSDYWMARMLIRKLSFCGPDERPK